MVVGSVPARRQPHADAPPIRHGVSAADPKNEVGAVVREADGHVRFDGLQQLADAAVICLCF